MIGTPRQLVRSIAFIATVAIVAEPLVAGDDESDSASRFPDEPIPLKLDEVPQRPRPLLELGPPFLGTGPLDPGFEMPGGAVVQPSFLLFGTYRTALQTFDDGSEQSAQWVNRLDLFGNLQLTGTERILAGVRPLDRDGRFTRYQFRPNDGWDEQFNFEITTLFFEGDLGEMFPGVDPQDQHATDWGVSVGRQPVVFQEGLLINDRPDGVALVRDSLFPKGGSDLKLTFFYSWGNISRNDNRMSSDAQLVALFTESDFPKNTLQMDVVYVNDTDADSLHWGVGSVQRIGHLNTAFRALGSHALEEESPATSSGYLLFGEVSWTPVHTHDNMYVNGFWAIDEFASAARAPATGGPLGRLGLLFAAVGLGQYGAPIGNRTNNGYGAVVGRQWFFDHNRKQLNVEAGGRVSTNRDFYNIAIGARYQQAFGQHFVLQLDGFVGSPKDLDTSYGARVELRIQF